VRETKTDSKVKKERGSRTAPVANMHQHRERKGGITQRGKGWRGAERGHKEKERQSTAAAPAVTTTLSGREGGDREDAHQHLQSPDAEEWLGQGRGRERGTEEDEEGGRESTERERGDGERESPAAPTGTSDGDELRKGRAGGHRRREMGKEDKSV